MAKSHQKNVVITGCDIPNSYGYELALCLDHQGYVVFAGCTDCNSVGARSLASRGSTRLAVMQIDVTKQDEIDDATEMIQDMIGDEGLWAVVNCAEFYTVAEADWCSVEDYEQSMQVNYLGTVRVTKSLLHLIRRGRGRIVNLSSMAGCLARAGQSAYSASKFALEAFTDSLRQEMLKWGVYVTLVEPAYFPEGSLVLSEPQTSVRLKRVPDHVKEVYGEDYFVDFINSVSRNDPTTQEEGKSKSAETLLPKSSSSTLTSGYSSLSSTSASLKKKIPSTVIANPGDYDPETQKEEKKRRTLSLGGGASSTLKSSPDFGNTNRVLHALAEAVTAHSPKVRYFVGSFQDRLVKSASAFFPTVVMDTYLTSGSLSKCVPRVIKEKQE
ncbi:17-beta-hydroxysteroid dehydrogenase type 6 [Ciona intestinalis]